MRIILFIAALMLAPVILHAGDLSGPDADVQNTPHSQSLNFLIPNASPSEAQEGISTSGEIGSQNTGLNDSNDQANSVSLYRNGNFDMPDRAISLLAGNTIPEKNFLFIVEHRNREPVDEEPFHDLLGFDGGGLKIGLGMRYGFLDNLDAGVYRSNGTNESFDTYEFDVRWRLLVQNQHGIDLAIRPGFSIFTQKEEDDGSGVFAQLLASRTWGRRCFAGTGILYHSESSGAVKKNTDDEHSVAVSAFMDFFLFSWLTWNVESACSVNGYGADHPIISSSFKIFTYGHTFSIVFSNSQYTTADGIVSNSERGFGDTVIGFAITRTIPFEW